jgi:predicted DNA-binding protein (MmcQ/YjbR family)
MDADGLKLLCQGFPGAQHVLYPHPSNILVYEVGGKKFAYFKTSDPEKWRFSIRVTAERFVELTGVPGIKPARYMGRFHWVSIVHPEMMPEDYLAELVGWSYQRALASLSKTARAALPAPSP